MPAETFWVDGEIGALVPPDDRGLALADGVFETLRVAQGVISWREYHEARLLQGLRVLSFSNPQDLASRLLLQTEQQLAADLGAVSGTLRLTVTRGSGPRGYGLPIPEQPRSVVRFSPGLPDRLPPARLAISPIAWAEQPVLAGCKLLARTEQVLAMTGARASGFDEAIMCDPEGAWLSTASGNLFLRLGSVLVTPPITAAGIAGTRRQVIIEQCAAALGYRVEVRAITLADQQRADEAMFCNSVIGVRGIESVEDRSFSCFEAAEALNHQLHPATAL